MKGVKLLNFSIAISGMLLILIQADTVSSADYTHLCRLFKPNTQVRIPGSCDQYMICNGQTAKLLKCDKNLKYDAKKQKCEATVANADQLCQNHCYGSKDGVWKADPTNCRSYYYCQNGQSLAGHCGVNLEFDEAQQMCVYTKNSKCIDVNNICELVPDGTTFLDETNCSQYHECKKGKSQHVTTACKKDNYYSVEQGSCLPKTSVACNAHPKVKCKKNLKIYVGLLPDEATCRGYFRCTNKGKVEDIDPMWYQCPLGTFFSEDHQACVHPVDAKCNADRCESRGNALVNSGNNNCHNYLVCKNNKTVEEVTCHNDYFFDELIGACVPRIIYYNCCDEPDSYLNNTMVTN